MFVGRTGPVTHAAVTWSRQLPSDYQLRLSIQLWRRGRQRGVPPRRFHTAASPPPPLFPEEPSPGPRPAISPHSRGSSERPDDVYIKPRRINSFVCSSSGLCTGSVNHYTVLPSRVLNLVSAACVSLSQERRHIEKENPANWMPPFPPLYLHHVSLSPIPPLGSRRHLLELGTVALPGVDCEQRRPFAWMSRTRDGD
ncbi:hypothetical protein MRX96_007102 [Rhipicephalus microplus]